MYECIISVAKMRMFAHITEIVFPVDGEKSFFGLFLRRIFYALAHALENSAT